MPGYDNHTNDAWGYPFLYAIGDDGTVTLTSLGSDGKVGGTGDAADVSHCFIAKQADGKWSEELVDWLPAAAVQPTK